MQFFSRTFISCNIPKERSLWLGAPKECISKAKVTTGYFNNSIISCVFEKEDSQLGIKMQNIEEVTYWNSISLNLEKNSILIHMQYYRIRIYIFYICVCGGEVWVWNTLGFSPEEG